MGQRSPPSPAPPTYGQVVIGPPGSGKTTYCNGMQQYLRLLGRNAWVVNLDPANERVSERMNRSRDGQHHPEEDASRRRRRQQKERENTEADPDTTRILPYETIFNVCDEVVNITSVMKETGLGPNGGLIYCMEYLEAHAEAIVTMIRNRLTTTDSSSSGDNKEDNNSDHPPPPPPPQRYYLIFDLPGQVELYTHSTCVQKLLVRLTKALDLRLTSVQLVDANYCADASKFLSAALLSTTTMLRLELPTVNVLSKVDLLEQYGGGMLDFSIEYYAECHDLERLVPFVDQSSSSAGVAGLENEEDSHNIAEDVEYQTAKRRRRSSSLSAKFAKLHKALAEVVEDFGLLHFIPLNISDAASVGRVLARVDKCNGYVFTEQNIASDMFQCAIQQEREYEALADIKERFMSKPSRQTEE